VVPVESDGCCPASEVAVGSVCAGSDASGSVPSEVAGSLADCPPLPSLEAAAVEVSSPLSGLVVAVPSEVSVGSVVVSSRVDIFIPSVVAGGRYSYWHCL
jgi:hypothetical protein